MLPVSPERVAQKAFFPIKVNFSRIKSATKFFCVKTPSGKVVVRPFPHLTVHRYWRETLTLQPKIWPRSDPPPSKNTDFDRSSLKTSQLQEICEQIQLWRIGNRAGLSNDGVRTLPLSLPKGGSTTDFSVFWNKIQYKSNKVCYELSFFAWKLPSAELIEQSISYEITNNRTESVSFHLKYWLKLTYPVVAIARRTLSALPNDVMSIIQSGQLHSELFGRRHSTLQCHGLFALAKRLFIQSKTGAL